MKKIHNERELICFSPHSHLNVDVVRGKIQTAVKICTQSATLRSFDGQASCPVYTGQPPNHKTPPFHCQMTINLTEKCNVSACQTKKKFTHNIQQFPTQARCEVRLNNLG